MVDDDEGIIADADAARADGGGDRAATTAARDPATEAKLAQWVSAKRQRDFATSDRLRDELRAGGVDPESARAAPRPPRPSAPPPPRSWS